MRVLTGMSGWSYKEWKPDFYPERLPVDAMLAHYATRFPTVEVNNTFYRMPRESVLLGWAGQVPADFLFSVKASRRITHDRRLEDVGDLMEFVLRTANVLRDRRGPMLFQLPPNLKKDLSRLDAFLALLPKGWRAALGCRHLSWFDDEVFERLRARDVAMVLSDEAEWSAPMVATASWGYLRLHRPGYTEADLQAWARQVGAQPWSEAFVYFKHEMDIAGPGMALRFQSLVAGRVNADQKMPSERAGANADQRMPSESAE